jgi:membrane protein
VRQRFRLRHADQALREMVAVALGAVITRDFLGGGPRRSAAALAPLLGVPPQLVDDVLDALVRAGLVVRAVSGREIAYVPGGDVDALRADDLRDALRRDPEAREIRAAVGRELGPDLQRLLRDVEEGRSRREGGLTLRELAASLGHGASPPRLPRRAPAPGPPQRAGDGGDLLDPKQPDVPP